MYSYVHRSNLRGVSFSGPGENGGGGGVILAVSSKDI